MEEFEREFCIRGYYVYKDIWDAAVGKELLCEREPLNAQDRYAVAVKRGGIIAIAGTRIANHWNRVVRSSAASAS